MSRNVGATLEKTTTKQTKKIAEKLAQKCKKKLSASEEYTYLYVYSAFLLKLTAHIRERRYNKERTQYLDATKPKLFAPTIKNKNFFFYFFC